MYIGYAMCIILWQIWQKHGCGASAWQPFFRHVFSLVSNLRGSQGLVWGEAAAATLLGICRDALVSSVGTTSNKHDHLGSNCQAMYELGIATGMLLAALLNLLLQAIGGFFTNWSFSLRRSMSAKSWRVIWGHMGSYDVIWYRSKTDQKNKNNQGFRLPRLAVKSLVDAAKSSTYPSTLEDSSPIGISQVMFLLHHCLSHLLKFTPQFLTLEDWSYWKRAFYCYQCDFFWGCFDCFLGCMVLSSRQGAQRGGSVGNPGLLAISGASFWAVAFQWGNAEIGMGMMGYFEWSHPLILEEHDL